MSFMTGESGTQEGFKFTIGIDPGKDTGFAAYWRHERKLVVLRTMDFWETYRQVTAYDVNAIACIYVECPDTKHIWQAMPQGTKAIQRQAVNVGGVLREAELLYEGLRRAGFTVRKMNPRKKRTQAEFQKLTGWTGKTNQHCRDAALLCWGR